MSGRAPDDKGETVLECPDLARTGACVEERDGSTNVDMTVHCMLGR